MSVSGEHPGPGWRALALVALLAATALAVVLLTVGRLASGPAEAFDPTARAAVAAVIVACVVATRRRARSMH